MDFFSDGVSGNGVGVGMIGALRDVVGPLALRVSVSSCESGELAVRLGKWERRLEAILDKADRIEGHIRRCDEILKTTYTPANRKRIFEVRSRAKKTRERYRQMARQARGRVDELRKRVGDFP